MKFETVVEEGLTGVVTKEPPPSLWNSRSPSKNNSSVSFMNDTCYSYFQIIFNRNVQKLKFYLKSYDLTQIKYSALMSNIGISQL